MRSLAVVLVAIAVPVYADARKPSVSIGIPEGPLDDKVMTAMFVKALPALTACYVDARKQTPTLAGDIAVAGMIDAAGKLSGVEAHLRGPGIAVDAPPSTLEKCTAAVVRKLAFGKPTEAGSIAVSLSLDGGVDGTPTVATLMPIAVGDLDKVVIKRVIKDGVGGYARCYTTALAADTTSKLHGEIRVAFYISEAGKVEKAEARLGDGMTSAVGDCVATAFAALAFPKPRSGGVQVVAPLVFHRTGG